MLKGDIAPFAINQEGEYDMRAEDIRGLMFLPQGTIGTFLRELVAEGRLQKEYKRGYSTYKVPEVVTPQQ